MVILQHMDHREAAEAWLDLSRVHGSLRVELARRLEAEVGIGLPETELLLRLSNAPDHRMRMCDLAQRLTMAQSGVTRLVDRAVQQGWVTREQRADDRRTTYAVLTEAGSAAGDRAQPTYVGVISEPFGRLSVDDRARLRAALHEVLGGIGATCGVHDPD